MKNDNLQKEDHKLVEEKEEIYYGVKGFFIEIIKIFLLALIVIVPIRVFLFQPFFVQGASMEPTFEDGQYLIVNELGYKKTDLKITTVEPFKNINRGDVMIFRYPKNPKQYFIKRVIGLPDEELEIKGGKVIIYNEKNPQGFQLKEEYLPEGSLTEGGGKHKINNNKYFVMGDNRSHSSDSRMWGPIETGDIIGRVLFRAWPVSDIKIFK